MNSVRVAVGLVLVFALVLPGVARAQAVTTEENKLPEGTAFHLDARWVTVFDLGIATWDQEKQIRQRVDTGSLGGILGTSMYGMKLGWLVNGRHDVGFHVLFGMNGTTVKYDPDASGLATTKTRLVQTRYRAAFYYNYNWRPNTWVMPYLGPLLGVQGGVDQVFVSGRGNNSTREDFGFLPGLEVGVKLFPFRHVAFDLGVLGTYDIARQRVDYKAAKNKDDTGAFGQLNVGVYAGLNIYFGKEAKPKPCPECPACPMCPVCPQPVAAPAPTTLTVIAIDKCSGQALAPTVAANGAALATAAKEAVPAGPAKVTVGAPGYDAKTVDATMVAGTENMVKVALYKHIQLTGAVYFATGKSDILPKSYPVLDDAIKQIQGTCEFTKIVVAGHTDNVGKAEMNKTLSQKRAESVMAYLVAHGVDAAKLEAVGYGMDKPIASNDTPEGKAQNRRVEFTIE